VRRGGVGHIGGQRIGGGFFVPEDAEDPPTRAVVEELNAVDAADEGLVAGGVARFVAAEDLGDVAEAFDAVDDGGFKEAVGGEIFAGALDIIVDGEKTDGAGGGVLGGAGEASFGDEERAEAVPVALARRAGDDVVDGGKDGVEGFYVVGLGGRDAGGEILRRRGLRLRS